MVAASELVGAPARSRVRRVCGEDERRRALEGGNGRTARPGAAWREEKAREGQVATRASSTCSSSSVAFHRAAWVRGEVDDREEGVGLGRLGLALGAR